MREVKFRGKRVDNGEWVYGDLLKNQDGAFIVLNSEAFNHSGDGCDLYATEWYEVIPASVSEFTGLKDANGIEIYEGDVLLFNNTHPNAHLENWLCVVKYRCGSFVCEYPKDGVYNHFDSWNDFVKWEVVGNIFKNKNLLEDKR